MSVDREENDNDSFENWLNEWSARSKRVLYIYIWQEPRVINQTHNLFPTNIFSVLISPTLSFSRRRLFNRRWYFITLTVGSTKYLNRTDDTFELDLPTRSHPSNSLMKWVVAQSSCVLIRGPLTKLSGNVHQDCANPPSASILIDPDPKRKPIISKGMAPFFSGKSSCTWCYLG